MPNWTNIENAIDFWDPNDPWGTGLDVFTQDEKNFIIASLRHFYEVSPIAEGWLNLLYDSGNPSAQRLRIGKSSAIDTIDFNYIRYNADTDLVMIAESGTVVRSRPEYQLLHEVLHLVMRRHDNQSPDIFYQNQANYDFWGPILAEERKIAAEMSDFDQRPSAY